MKKTINSALITDMDVFLRRADIGDLDLVLGFVSQFHAEEELVLAEAERRGAVTELIERPELGGIWLIFEGEVAVGYIALCLGYSLEFCGRDAFIDEFYIAADYRGKGIGTWVVDLFKTEAKELGLKALHLEVAKANIPARKLYEKFDFVQRGKYLGLSVIL